MTHFDAWDVIALRLGSSMLFALVTLLYLNHRWRRIRKEARINYRRHHIEIGFRACKPVENRQ